MRTRGRYKEIIRDRVVTLRLNAEELHRLKANALRAGKPASRLIRERMADLIAV